MQLALIEKDCSVFDFIEHYLCQRANNTQISYRGILREWCANFNCSYGKKIEILRNFLIAKNSLWV